MPVRVLVVDDSSFFRRQIEKLLSSDPELEVIGSASNGQEAIVKARQLKPDVITMDIEMPVMNGILATRAIMQESAIPILMFSSLTTDGAKATLDALDAGAVDFIPKRFEDISRKKDEVQRILCEKVREIGKNKLRSLRRTSIPSKPVETKPASSTRSILSSAKKSYKLLAIGTSTGGPVALQEILTKLPASFPLPILLIQHMPATFTPAFSSRLNQSCNISVKEAENGDVLEAGSAYLAPGGKQMTLIRIGTQIKIAINEGDSSLTYRPSVDVTFSSIAEILPRQVLAVILTGMGADGCEGAKKLKKNGATIWGQDEATSVVYGMPAAVADAGIVDKVLPLQEFSTQLVEHT